jgi:hypothetical protein
MSYQALGRRKQQAGVGISDAPAKQGRLVDMVPSRDVARWSNAELGSVGMGWRSPIVPTDTEASQSFSAPGFAPDKSYKYRYLYSGASKGPYLPYREDFGWKDGVISAVGNQASVMVFSTWPSDIAAVQLMRMIVEECTDAEYCDYATSEILDHGTPSDVRPYAGTLAQRLANCPTLLNALTNGGDVSIAVMGDSFQASCNATGRPLLSLAYPTTDFHMFPVALGSHGADLWVAEGQSTFTGYLQGALTAATGVKVMYFGGISDAFTDVDPWLTIVDWAREAVPGVEIILGDRSDGVNAEASRAIVEAAAAAKSTAFFDAAATINNWVSDSGWDINTWRFDNCHFDERGCRFLGRALASFLGAAPP